MEAVLLASGLLVLEPTAVSVVAPYNELSLALCASCFSPNGGRIKGKLGFTVGAMHFEFHASVLE